MEYAPSEYKVLRIAQCFLNLKSNTGHQIIVRVQFAKPTSTKLVLLIKFLFLLSPPYA